MPCRCKKKKSLQIGTLMYLKNNDRESTQKEKEEKGVWNIEITIIKQQKKGMIQKNYSILFAGLIVKWPVYYICLKPTKQRLPHNAAF